MKPNQISGNQITLIGIISGLIGGALLIAVSVLSTKGYWVIAVYALVMMTTFSFVRTKKYVDITFTKWLVIGVLAFALMSCVIYAYILIFVNPAAAAEMPLSAHLIRFVMILGGGAAVSALLGLFFIKRKQNSLQVS